MAPGCGASGPLASGDAATTPGRSGATASSTLDGQLNITNGAARITMNTTSAM
jgi:hypothetical protein